MVSLGDIESFISVCVTSVTGLRDSDYRMNKTSVQIKLLEPDRRVSTLISNELGSVRCIN